MAFDNAEIEKHKFHYPKHPIDIYNVNIDKIMIPNEVSFVQKGFKYFTGYKDNEIVKPLCIMLLIKLNICRL